LFIRNTGACSEMQPSVTVFSQIVSSLYHSEFSRCAEQFPMRKPPRGLSAYDQFLALCFGQLTYRESLRDVAGCLKAKEPALYHLGFRGRLSRTNLAYANQHRDWRLFAAVAEVLMRRAARLYQDFPNDPDLPNLAFVLDSSLIGLSLKLFSWGSYNRFKRALKLHLMLSLQGNLPAWAAVTESKLPDMKILDRIPVTPGAYYIMDRGYLDFVRLFRLHSQGAYFVVRNKHHVRFRVLERRPVDKGLGLRSDLTIRLTSNWSIKSFPGPLRKITIYDAQNDFTLVLLTNQFDLPAEVIGELYRKRWQVELFFKWIKQHLRIRSFYGRSENAVRCQIWAAICAYLMVAITKRRLGIEKSLNEMLQIVSVSIFEQCPIAQLLTSFPAKTTPVCETDEIHNMLLFKDI
jgi:hypothetical protein